MFSLSVTDKVAGRGRCEDPGISADRRCVGKRADMVEMCVTEKDQIDGLGGRDGRMIGVRGVQAYSAVKENADTFQFREIAGSADVGASENVQCVHGAAAPFLWCAPIVHFSAFFCHRYSTK